MTTTVTGMTHWSSSGRVVWRWRASCGHYLVPDVACDEEPNQPMAWCSECEEWAFFEGMAWDGDRLTICTVQS